MLNARVYLEGAEIQAELWEHPKPAARRLRAAERLAILAASLSSPPRTRSPGSRRVERRRRTDEILGLASVPWHIA